MLNGERHEVSVYQLHLTGRNIAMGYLESEELTKSSFMEENGTFQTDDLGRTDKEGYLYIIGSKSGDALSLCKSSKRFLKLLHLKQFISNGLSKSRSIYLM